MDECFAVRCDRTVDGGLNLGGTIELLARLVISMAVVMAVMALAARVVRHRVRSRPGRRGQPEKGPDMRRRVAEAGFSAGACAPGRPLPPVEVTYRRALTKGAWVTVVDVGDRRFLVGGHRATRTMRPALRAPDGPNPGRVPDRHPR